MNYATEKHAAKAGFKKQDGSGDLPAMKRSLLSTDVSKKDLDAIFTKISQGKKDCKKEKIGDFNGKPVYKYSFDSPQTAEAFKAAVRNKGTLEPCFPTEYKAHHNPQTAPATKPASPGPHPSRPAQPVKLAANHTHSSYSHKRARSTTARSGRGAAGAGAGATGNSPNLSY